MDSFCFGTDSDSSTESFSLEKQRRRKLSNTPSLGGEEEEEVEHHTDISDDNGSDCTSEHTSEGSDSTNSSLELLQDMPKPTGVKKGKRPAPKKTSLNKTKKSLSLRGKGKQPSKASKKDIIKKQKNKKVDKKKPKGETKLTAQKLRQILIEANRIINKKK